MQIIDECVKNEISRKGMWSVGGKYVDIEEFFFADGSGWYVFDMTDLTCDFSNGTMTTTKIGRRKRIFYRDIARVDRTYTDGVTITVCVLFCGLLHPCFDGKVSVWMKDGTTYQFSLSKYDMGKRGNLYALAPLWFFIPKYPMKQLDRIGEAFEYMRIQHQVR